jgi:hypothetical protein
MGLENFHEKVGKKVKIFKIFMKIVKQSFFYLQFLGGLGSANWVFWRSSSGAVVNSLQHAPNLVIEKYEFVK